MPKLVLLGGPTGVGKSTVMRLLENRIPHAALLDADDVWRVSKELTVEQNRHIALSNVISVMRGYLRGRHFTIRSLPALMTWSIASIKFT